MPKARTRDVSRGAYRAYRKKGEDFASLARTGLAAGNANGAGLCAIHAVISLADALVTFHVGARSTSRSHDDAAELLDSVALDGKADGLRQVRSVLALKNRVEYEERELTPEEASRLCLHMDRFGRWASKHLPE
jgi:hypothetical protein